MDRRFHRSAGVCFSLLMVWLCVAAKHATVTSSVEPAAAPAGQAAAISITVDVQEGLHAQSHTPKDKNLIPLTVKMDANLTFTFGEVVYPPAEEANFPELGPVSIYTGKIVVRVPVTIPAGTPAGPQKLSGKVRLQTCNDKACFAPENIPFEATLTVTSGGATAEPAIPQPTTIPTTLPAAAVTSPPSTMPVAAGPTVSGNPSAAAPPPKIFGFDLAHNAYPLAFVGAFIVGIIFNAMPCVLPVVPLKIMGFYEASQHDRRKSLALGAVFSLGLISSFGVLALLIVALRVLNWGGLFQQTWFTVAIVIVLVTMAISLFGFFTVNLPVGIYQFTPRHDTYVGNFLFGILTAALSTPCTFGMFVGLLTWAISQPAAIGVALLMTVGTGMAFPYFVLSGFPEAARNFPRTGPWSEVIKQSLAFLLLATAVYFAQPLVSRIAPSRTIWWIEFAVALAAGAFVLTRAVQLSKTARPIWITAAVVILAEAGALFAALRLTNEPYKWINFSDQTFAEARASGKPVLVDFTATWCGNCHWIEAFVLTDRRVINAVKDHDVVMLKADVTDDGSPGKPLLDKLNAAGAIPLTAVYSASSSEPRTLDGIYSVNDLLKMLQSDNAK